MDGNCNLENVIYQANIFPKKGTSEFPRLKVSSDATITMFLWHFN